MKVKKTKFKGLLIYKKNLLMITEVILESYFLKKILKLSFLLMQCHTQKKMF